MSLRVCLGCSTVYADGLKACPHCGADDKKNSYDWEEESMKTNAAGVSTLHLEEGQEAVDVPGDVVLVGPGSDEVVEEESFLGNSSEASKSKTGKSVSSSSGSQSEPAPTTGPRSSTAKASDDAPTTAGSTPGTTSPKSTGASESKLDEDRRGVSSTHINVFRTRINRVYLPLIASNNGV